MTKQELLENHTMEQLADKIIALEIAISDMKNTEKIIKQYNSKQCDCENVGVIIKCPDCGKSNIFELDEKSSQLIRNKLTDRINCLNNESRKLYGEIYNLKDQLQRKETTINQIDDILNELFGVTHGTDKEPEELKKILKIFINAVSTPTYELIPAEPIKLADFLINVKGEYERSAIGKAFYGNDKGTYNLFDVSELRQIAEHLLVYCNSQKEDDNE